MERYTAEMQGTNDDADDGTTKVRIDINSASGSQRSNHDDRSHEDPSSTEGKTQGAGMMDNVPSLPG